MQKKSESTIRRLVRIYQEFYELVFDAAKEWEKATGESAAHLSEIDCIDEFSIELRGEHSYCSCCGPEHFYLKFPTKFLYDPEGALADWEERVGKKKREEVERKRREAEEEARRQEERERRLLVELKTKYEGNDGNTAR